jgi:hypothetical protein
MPVFIKRGTLNQYILNINVLMVPLHIHIVVKGFYVATCQVGSNIIDQYTCILTNNAQDTLQSWIKMWHKQNKKIFSVVAKILSVPRFCRCRYLNPDLEDERRTH